MIDQQSAVASVTSIQHPFLATWLCQALVQGMAKDQKIWLRGRLRGNNLHILCESERPLIGSILISHVTRGLRQQIAPVVFLANPSTEAIYRLIFYGRKRGQRDIDWIEPLELILFEEGLELSVDLPSSLNSTIPQESSLLLSYQSLAQSGSPEAIARYLSDQFYTLGVSIQAFVHGGEEGENQRLWVQCHYPYSPEPSLLQQPLTAALRQLHLTQYKDAVIRAQVWGEPQPDWMVQVDLTPPTEMLRRWAQWGDVAALVALINEVLIHQEMQAAGELRDRTLHVFCAATLPLADHGEVVRAIRHAIGEVSPQGIEAITLYGMDNLEDRESDPHWVDWITLPAATIEELQSSTQTLAHQGNRDAMEFLVHRLLNPDLEQWLGTGGLRVKFVQKDKEHLLHLMVEGVQCPDREGVVSPLIHFFGELGWPEIHGLRIYGRQAGQKNPRWQYGHDFQKPAADLVDLVPEFESTPEPATYQGMVIMPVEGAESLPLAPWRDRLRQEARQWLCATRLFSSTPPPSVGPGQKNLTPQRYPWSWVAAMLVVGMGITGASDRLLGRWLETQKEQPVAIASPEELDLALASGNAPPSPKVQNQQNQGFLQNRGAGVSAARLAAARFNHPTFNNPLLDDKVALYQQHLKEKGVPDVLIVGSSRALRGVDPLVLAQGLQRQGLGNVDVFNFGINGATVKIVDLVLQQILTPDQLPKVVIFADGARAFNSGRKDTTFDMIANSPGYAELLAGRFPRDQKQAPNTTSWELAQVLSQANQDLDRQLQDRWQEQSPLYRDRQDLKDLARQTWVSLIYPNYSNPSGNPAPADGAKALAEAITLEGFLPMAIKFDPITYYQSHPLVLGAYDNDYQNFDLYGQQHEALLSLVQYLQSHQVQLMFVNQPLTDRYLDPMRLKHEREFRTYLRRVQTDQEIAVVDLASDLQWQRDYGLFSDPSHLNQWGAYRVSQQLLRNPNLAWSQWLKSGE